MEWGQPTNGSAARQHSSQSHGFAVRLWSTLCICSPGLVKLVRSNLAPDFPLFHGFHSSAASWPLSPAQHSSDESCNSFIQPRDYPELRQHDDCYKLQSTSSYPGHLLNIFDQIHNAFPLCVSAQVMRPCEAGIL